MKQPPDRPAPLVDQAFIDARARLIDIAAFLDRVQRHGQEDDYRVVALKKALAELSSTTEGRAERILLALSDQSTTPIATATVQGAFGAVRPT